MIKFKQLKYKHFRRAREIKILVDNGQISDDDIVAFALDLVEAWDFVDVETGRPLPLGEMDELSQGQLSEVLSLFAGAFSQPAAVPKVNGGPSPSTSMP